MREFFRRWRRKIGRVTLVMASVFAGLWLRTNFLIDKIRFSIDDRGYFILAGSGVVIWEPHGASRWGQTFWIIENVNPYLAMFDLSDKTSWVIFYSTFAILLTLVSAVLLVWPSRRTKPQPVAMESGPDAK